MSREPTAFRLNIPDAALEDLRGRLARTRLPDEPPLEPWPTGTSRAYMEELVAYWRSGFDWRAQEASLNRFRQFTVPLGGIDLHFIHEPGRGPRRCRCCSRTAGRDRSSSSDHPALTDPALRRRPRALHRRRAVAAGLRALVPPGPAALRRSRRSRTCFAELMTDVLGYRRFAAQGGDWGAFVSSVLGWRIPRADRNPPQPAGGAARPQAHARDPTPEERRATWRSSRTG